MLWACEGRGTGKVYSQATWSHVKHSCGSSSHHTAPQLGAHGVSAEQRQGGAQQQGEHPACIGEWSSSLVAERAAARSVSIWCTRG